MNVWVVHRFGNRLHGPEINEPVRKLVACASPLAHVRLSNVSDDPLIRDAFNAPRRKQFNETFLA